MAFSSLFNRKTGRFGSKAVVEKALEPVRDWRQFRAWMAIQPPKRQLVGAPLEAPSAWS